MAGNVIEALLDYVKASHFFAFDFVYFNHIDAIKIIIRPARDDFFFCAIIEHQFFDNVLCPVMFPGDKDHFVFVFVGNKRLYQG